MLQRSCGFVLIAIALTVLACGTSWAKHAAAGSAASQSAQTNAAATEALKPAQVDGFMAKLSDAQARSLLAEKLKEEAKDRQSQQEVHALGIPVLADLFYSQEQALNGLLGQVDSLFSGAEDTPALWTATWERLTEGQGVPYLLAALAKAALALLAGLIAEWIFRRATRPLHDQLQRAIPQERMQRVGTIISRLVLDALGLLCFAAISFLAFVAMFPRMTPAHGTASIVIIGVFYYRIIRYALGLLLSPNTPSLGLLGITGETARFIHRWLMRIILAGLVIGVSSSILKQVGKSQELFLLTQSSAGLLAGLLLAAMILSCRKDVAASILASCDVTPPPPSRRLLADFWHYPALAYALGIGCYWTLRMALHGDVTILKLVYSLFLIPICIGLDIWMQRLLRIVTGEDRVIIDMAPAATTADEASPEAEAAAIRDRISGGGIGHIAPMIRKVFRFVLAAFLIFATFHIWGLDIPLGWLFARNVMSIILVLLLGLLSWELVKVAIDRKLRDEMQLPGEDMEEGTGVGSRSATLLLLLRKFIMCVLFVIVSLIVLSSVGVDIGPLIAGAGVIGLAIGFGAQTLVKDIIAGVFFLIDDAFRIGDYVETGSAKGTVEQISLRSLKLRHPRGMVFTVPFGGLKTVKNFSRDYIVSKLQFRIDYDSDINKIRKIIKRINKELQENPDHKRAMLSSLKSQGVRRMEDSAMILQVKFKSIPGQQFTVESEIFRLIQSYFKEQGIRFAHRNVTVYLPPETSGRDGHEHAAIGAAAAAAVAQAEAEEEAKALEAGSSKDSA